MGALYRALNLPSDPDAVIRSARWISGRDCSCNIAKYSAVELPHKELCADPNILTYMQGCKSTEEQHKPPGVEREGVVNCLSEHG